MEKLTTKPATEKTSIKKSTAYIPHLSYFVIQDSSNLEYTLVLRSFKLATFFILRYNKKATRY